MDIGRVDTSATMGDSWLHRASPTSKLVALGLVLLAVIVTWNIIVIAIVALMLVAGVTSARLDPKLTYGLAAYPAVFALIFAVASAPDVPTGTVIVLKAVTAGLASVMVILTTPYPYIFAPIQRVVPGIVGDALLMTYRALFLLLEKLSNLLTAVKLRSGLSGRQPVRSARASMQALGGLLLYSFDLSQRDYDIMRLRGYEKRLRVTMPPRVAPGADAVLVVVTGLAAAIAVLWRVDAVQLNPYSWILLALPVLLFAAALLARRRPA